MRRGGCYNAEPLYLAILDRHLHRPAFFPWRLLRLSGRRQIQGHVRTTAISMITAHDDAVKQELLRQTQNDCNAANALALQAHDATRVQTCCSLNGSNGPSRDPATLGVLQQLKSVLNVSIVLETWNNAAKPLQGFAKGLSIVSKKRTGSYWSEKRVLVREKNIRTTGT